MRVSLRMLGPAAAVLLLTACSDETAPAAADEGAGASGEILEASVSDAMIPLDTLKSRPPHQKAAPSATGGSAVEGEEAGEEGTDAEAETAPVEDASTAAPEN